MDEKYMEDLVLKIPNSENNPLTFGTLFDCRQFKTSSSNLFTTMLTKKEYFNICPLKNKDYRLVYVKNIKDKLKILKIDGSVSVEVLSGIINIEGRGHYNNTFSKNVGEEQLICQYCQDDYYVELLPKASGLIDNTIKEQLINKTITATHIVSGITFGAEVNAEIRIKQNDTCQNASFRDYLIGSIHFGKVDASLKTKLEKLDTEMTSNYEMQISVNSRPPIQQEKPASIKQMFELIESVDTSIQKDPDYKFINITGVSIQFTLVPIYRFLKFEGEKFYKQLQDNALENFLIKLKKYQSSEYIKNHVLKKEPRLQFILSDNQSKLSKDILEFQKELRKKTEEDFKSVCDALRKYKIAQCTYKELFQKKQDYDKSDFSTEKVRDKIKSFVSYGRQELSIVCEKDATINIKYFTNLDKLEEWFNSRLSVKVLLRTSLSDSSNSTIHHLIEIADALQKQNIEVGIAFPSVLNDFSLEIKDYDDSKIYRGTKEILQVLEILNAAIGVGNPIKSRFYMLYALCFKIQFPIQDFTSLNKLISLVKINFNGYIAHNYIDSLQKIRDSKDGDFKFFVPLDATDTAFDAICEIKNISSKDCFSDVEWIFGVSGIPFSNAAPLILIFNGGKIKAVCLNKLDILILLQIFENKNFSVLSCSFLSHSFYPDRSKFSLEFIKTVDPTNIDMQNLDSVNLEIPFNQEPHKTLSDVLSIVRSASFGNDWDVISSIAHLATKNDNELKNLLTRHGWCTTDSKFKKIPEDLEKLNSQLKSLFKSRDSFFKKIDNAKDAVKYTREANDRISLRNLNQAIDSICNDKHCKCEFRDKLENLKENDIENRCNGYEKIFEQYSPFHITNLISLLEPMARPSKKESPDIFKGISNYIDRLPYNIEPYKSHWVDIKTLMDRKHLIDLTSLLAKLHNDPQLCKLHEQLNKISSIDNQNDIKNLFELLSEMRLTEEHKKYIWGNSRFLYLVTSNTPLAISTLFKSNDTKEFPTI
ncbi:14623_t:CDS:2 [Racocetra fulgida]|uniref:14623_t:CDS:1 n=1 Tax=Racocetra fulgida TaxID=60492 RepID=A0A9N9FIZ6_9GLOM|nr:14623_t:CDS:2 [Racocetra fulgida]